MKKQIIKLVCLCISLSGSTISIAQDSTRMEELLDKLPFTLHGSVDAYIQTNFNGKVTNDVANEAFSNKANSFELGMINLMFSKEIKKVGFMADIGFGPRAESANNTIYSNTVLAVKQLYVSYQPTDWAKVTFGNFSTFFGYELIEPQNNFNYSTSLAFQNGPFYHTGIKANFTKDKFNFLLGLFDDTDTKGDSDRNKYVGAQAGYTGDKGSVYLNFVGGNEPDESLQRKYKSSLDITSSVNVGKSAIGINAAMHRYRLKVNKDDDNASNAMYSTVYLYGKCPIKENGAIGVRVGYFNDKDYAAPYTAGDAKHYADVTLSGHYNIGPLKLLPEFRLDIANEEVFLNRDAMGSKIQPRLTFAAIYSF